MVRSVQSLKRYISLMLATVTLLCSSVSVSASPDSNLLSTGATHTIVVQSRLEHSSEPTALLQGGGVYESSEGATIIAQTGIFGFDFVGWFENYTASSNGTKVSEQASCSIETDRDRVLTAVYRPASTTITVTVSGSGYYVSGLSGKRSGTTEVEANAGTKLTITYENSEETFVHWEDGEKNILGKDKEYTFVMTRATTIRAVSLPAGSEEAYALIRFVDVNDKLLTAVYKSINDSIELPTGPAVQNKVFVGWDKTTEEIRGLMSTSDVITVKATYTDFDPTESVSSVSVPGFSYLFLKAGTTVQTAVLTNPAKNTCYLQAELFLADGTSLWKSGKIAPGGKSALIRLAKTLEKGRFEKAKIVYSFYKMDQLTPLTGDVSTSSTVVFTLVAE